MTASASPVRALELLASQRFELVIPRRARDERHDFIRALRNHPGYRAVPALAISGMARPQDIERALAAGFPSAWASRST